MAKTFFGAWWRPGSEGSGELGGILTIDEGRPHLDLVGSLKPIEIPPVGLMGFPLKEPIKEPVIYGSAVQLENSESQVRSKTANFTLLAGECNFPKPPGSIGGTERWTADVVLEGAHLRVSEEDPLFSGFAVQLHHLPVWAGQQGVEYEIQAQDPFRMTARTERHLLAKTVLPGGETCEIEQAPSFDTSWARFAMAHSVIFRVLPERPQTWHDLLGNYLQPLEALLWIASPDQNWVIEVKVLHVSQDQRQRQWTRLHAPLVQPYYAPPSRDSDRDDFLFVSGELPAGSTDSSPGFEIGYPHWLGVWNELRSVLIPVLSRSRAPFAYADDRLVTAAAALEALDKYSRKATGRLTSDLSTDEHEQRVAELKRILDEHSTPGLADWAVNAAKSMNHIGLRQRIEAMIEFCGDVGKALTGENAVLFAKQVVGLRTVSAHATSKSKGLGDELGGHYFAAAGLVWVLRVHMLCEIGFDRTDAIRRVLKHRKFRNDAQYLRAALHHVANPDMPYEPPQRASVMYVGRASKLPSPTNPPGE